MEDSGNHRIPSLSAVDRLYIAQTEWRKIITQTIDDTGAAPANREIQLSTTNQRKNYHWGDEIQNKRDGMLRVYAANANGFTLDRRGGQFDTYCTMLQEVQADVACGQEHNLDSIQSPV
jgi:hypothetical protein